MLHNLKPSWIVCLADEKGQEARWESLDSVLTQDKCYRDGELDEGFSSSLTQDRGYPSNEHESAQQTGVF
ncbi:MAG: hypothetical protein WBW41_21060, partial [Verrucomicrobiia bacterium]